jgi:hypothetical protein
VVLDNGELQIGGRKGGKHLTESRHVMVESILLRTLSVS